MRTYIFRRFLLAIPTILIVTIIVFSLSRLIPGSIIDMMILEHDVVDDAEALRQQIEEELGLSVPIHVQYCRWLGGVFRGDLGNSLWTDRPIIQELINRFPISFELGLIALITGLLIAIPVGIYSGVRQDNPGDYLARSFAILCIALPGFWLGTMVMIFPAIWWGWSPPMRVITFTENPLGNLGMFIIPGFILGMAMSGTVMRMMRTMMLEVLRQDYVRTAWSKGLRERTIVLSHVLRNAFIPVITVIGLRMPVLIGGSVVLERIFNLPGIGWYLIDAINGRDYVAISGINLAMAAFVLMLNLVIDLSYSYLDPRIQL